MTTSARSLTFVASIVGCILFAQMSGASGTVPSTARRLPNTVLWAWQRAEDLSKIDPAEMGVAYLACNIVLTGTTLRCHWRDQPVRLAPGTALVPVLRIDCDRLHPPVLSDEQANQIAALMTRIACAPGTVLVQIDFDALESQRNFYRLVLARTRAALPASMPISITVLASWCLFDNWIKDLPVDETVPMMFSLGRDRQKVLQYFGSHADFLVNGCCRSLGLSLEEQDVNQLMIPQARQRKIPVRIFVFTKSAWNDKKIETVRSMLSNHEEKNRH